MKQKQTRLLPRYPLDIPNIENYPLPKIGKNRRVASIVFSGEAVSASVGLSGNRFYRTGDYTSYRDALSWLIKERLGGEWDTHRYSFGIRARFFLGNRRKVDLDNLLKPVMDAGTGLVWADDSQVIELYGIVLRDDPDPRIEVLIYSIEDFVDYHHNCLYCGKELYGGKGLTRKFCSVKCANNAQRQGKERTCEECGKTFFTGRYKGQPRKLNARFCCRDCWRAWVRKNGKELIKNITTK